MGKEIIEHRWLDPCTGEEKCYTLEREVDEFEPLFPPLYNNVDYGNNPVPETVITVDGTIYERKIEATVRDGLAVGTILRPRGASASYYVSNFVKKVEKGLIYKFRRVDHSDPIDVDKDFFKEGTILVRKGHIHEK